MRAVIDIGSNSVLLLIAQRDADGKLEIHSDTATVTRLSQGAAATGMLAPEAIERTLETLGRYTESARAQGAPIEAVATEGLRMARNQGGFLAPAAAILGVPVRLISGDEEARLSYRSVALESPADRPLRVLDIGGGSTELVVGRGLEIESAVSHRVGAVRFSERFCDGHPPSPAALAAIEAATRASLCTQPLPPRTRLVGLAGTATTVGALLLGLDHYDRTRVDGSLHSLEAIVDLRRTLAAQTLAELQAVPLLGKGRADVIVAGITILIVCLEHCGATQLQIRDRGLRYALV